MSVLLLVLLCMLSATELISQWSDAGHSFPRVRTRVLGTPAPGYYVLDSPFVDSLAFLDHGGYWRMARASDATKAQKVHRSSMISAYRPGLDFDLFDSTLVKLSTLASDSAKTDFHDVTLTSDTTFLVLGRQEVIIDMSKIVSGGHSTAWVSQAVVEERTFSGRTLFRWKSLDHIPITQSVIDSALLRQVRVNYIHVNSAVLDSDGNILLSARHLDQVIKIHRHTGAVMWRLGGSYSKANDFRWLNDSTQSEFGFSHQHSVMRMSSGSLLLFDNGNLKSVKSSRAIILELDEIRKTVRVTQEFTPPSSTFTESMGSVTELPNGNILVGWGTNDRNLLFTEFHEDGTVAVEAFANDVVRRAYRVDKTTAPALGAMAYLSSTKKSADVGPVRIMSSDLGSVSSSFCVLIHRDPSLRGQHSLSGVCRVLDLRFSLFARDKQRCSLRIDVSKYVDSVNVFSLKLLHRGTDPQSEWRVVNVIVTSSSTSLEVIDAQSGEYVLFSAECPPPRVLFPTSGFLTHNRTIQIETSGDAPVIRRRYQISRDSLFRDTEIDTLVDDSSCTVTLGLSHSTYFLRVRDESDESTSSWSAPSDFRTSLLPPLALDSAYLNSEHSFVALRHSFTFRTELASDVLLIQLVNDNDESVIISSSSSSVRHTLSLPLESGMQYNVFARVLRNSDTSVLSTNLSFTTVSPVVLSAPSEFDSILPSQSLRVYWKSLLPFTALFELRLVRNTSTEVLYRGNRNSVVLPSGTLRGDSLYLELLVMDTNGRLVGYDDVHLASDVQFVEDAIQLLEPPTSLLVYPLWMFRWTGSRFHRFQFELSTLSSGVPDIVIATSDTILVPASVRSIGREGSWRVRAFDSTGHQILTTRRLIRLDSASVYPFHPLPFDTLVSLSGTIRYSPPKVHLDPLVQILDSSMQVVYATNPVDSTAGYGGLQPGRWYSWRVVYGNGRGSRDTSVVFPFRTRSLVSAITTEPASTWSFRGVLSLSVLQRVMTTRRADLYNYFGQALALDADYEMIKKCLERKVSTVFFLVIRSTDDVGGTYRLDMP